jgi:hypothetical protein
MSNDKVEFGQDDCRRLTGEPAPKPMSGCLAHLLLIVNLWLILMLTGWIENRVREIEKKLDIEPRTFLEHILLRR